jgi:hypothetical protein
MFLFVSAFSLAGLYMSVVAIHRRHLPLWVSARMPACLGVCRFLSSASHSKSINTLFSLYDPRISSILLSI